MKVCSLNYYQPKYQYHNPTCFKGNDLLSLSDKEVVQRVKSSIVPENFIGQGSMAEVYRIKDSDYCVRMPYLANDITSFSFSKELTPIDKVNHVVAKLGNGISIMKYFEGETPKEHRNSKLYRIQFQKKIANMPLKSYTDLLHQIANAIDNEMLFDFSGGNLIVDTKNNKLTAIDFYGISDNPKPIRPLTEMYSVLTYQGSEVGVGKKFFDNIVSAGLEEFKPNNIPCMDVELFDFEELCCKRDNDSYTKNYKKIISEITEQLKTLRSIKKSEIIDRTKGILLEDSIHIIKNLLSKIH